MNSVNTLYKEIVIPPFLNPESIGDLLTQVTQSEKENTRFIILKGSDAVFCNGLDLKWVTDNSKDSYLKEMQQYGALLKTLQIGNSIYIAVVKGSASGGGMGIVCASDYVIADESSTFSLPEGMLGLIPGMILPSLLNRLSAHQIKKMVLTGQKYPSSKAYQMGIADEVVNSNETQKAIDAAINSMKSCKREPVGDIKKLLYSSHINKDDLALLGTQILSEKLNETEIRERLKNIADFFEE